MRANIYPVPDPDLPFLGMHLTRNHAGEVLLGPTALFAGARDAYELRRVRPADLAGEPRLARDLAAVPPLLADRRHRDPARDQPAGVRRRVPALRARAERPPTSSAPAHSGVRAQAVGRDGSLIDDFVVETTDRAVHVRNAPSPAATSSLALAEEIADRVDALGPPR